MNTIYEHKSKSAEAVDEIYITQFNEIFEVGYNTLMELAEEKLLERAISITYQVKTDSNIIRAFLPPRRGIILQMIQHPFDRGITMCGFSHQKRWYIWVPS